MKTAVADAISKGVEGVTLQVIAGSAAERLYLNLGFEVVFRARIFVRD